MIRTAIIGATGYTGAEALEILLRHPNAQITYLTALQEECGHVADIFPQFKGRLNIMVQPLNFDKLAQCADVVLCCLPHKVSMGFVPKLLDTGLKVIDYSADYRLHDVNIYQQYYKVEHTDQSNLANAAFGLPELFREKIKNARLIANPGCFPTGAILAIAPLLRNKLISPEDIIVNAVTGTSGAGKNPSAIFHFPNMNENLFAYGVGVHRHMPEMEQIAAEVINQPTKILFQPHVGPFDRGILSTVYTQPTQQKSTADLIEMYKSFYHKEPFIRILDAPPKLKDIASTNYCHIYPTCVKGRFVCFSAIDNLIKGASGQAIQNMNIIFGVDEMAGLR
jgi:N-acetyl-gamma-glutamyl-phosphate reductase